MGHSVFQGQGLSEGSDLSWIFVYIFCTTDALATRQGVLMHYY